MGNADTGRSERPMSFVRIVSGVVLAAIASTSHGQQVAKLFNDELHEDAEFGKRVAISGETALIGAPDVDVPGVNAGKAFVFREVDGSWQQIAELDSEIGELARFGESVAIDGNTGIVGAPGVAINGIASGAAYIVREIDGQWQTVAELLPDDGEAQDRFGNSVAISGNTVIIGAPQNSEAGFQSGAAYVFREVGGVWEQRAKLLADDANGAEEQFGWRVALDGDMAAITSNADDDNGPRSGSAYIFERIRRQWEQIDKVLADDGQAFDFFGSSVSIVGGTALVGAGPADDDIGGTNSGAAYVFRDNGGDWQQVAKLQHEEPEQSDQFGASVALVGDGSQAVVGARFDDGPAGPDAGSAFLFRETPGGEWEQVSLFTPDDAMGFDRFGESVSATGGLAIVGAIAGDADEIEDTGAAYVFDLDLLACPIDLDGNGFVNADDFFLFLSLFSDGDPAVDFDGNGMINADDFFEFLALFAAGCP